MAGFTVGIMLIPQGMAYAYIAGLPPVYGLYAGLVPQIIYAFLGTSRQLAVGPIATDSLLVATGVSVLAVAGTDHYIALAILLAFLVGIIQFCFGLMRLGFLVNFIARPVISGFTSAAALIIGLSQLKHLTGIALPNSAHVHTLLYEFFRHAQAIHVPSVCIGLLGILLLKLLKKYQPALPAALLLVVLGILAVWGFHLEALGVKIIQDIPSGLPSFGLPSLDWGNIKALIPMAFTLAIIAFMEAIAIAKAMQNRNKNLAQDLDPNQELIALGMANILGSFFKAYPSTGGFSRTAVNQQAGAKTGVAALISASLMVLTLLFLTPLFYYLPKAILASIIMVAVFKLIDLGYPRFLWKVKKDDFWMLIFTFIATLSIGIWQGVLLGMVLSLFLVIYQTSQPHYAVLGKLPQTEEYRNIKRFEKVEMREDILIIRYDASLYFANMAHFKETLQNLIAEKGSHLQLIVLNSESINTIDATALEQLKDWVKELQKQSILLYMTGVKGPVRDILHQSGLVKEIGIHHFFLDIQHAIDFYDHNRDHLANQYAKQTNVK